MFAPMTFRTVARASGRPRYVQPTTQSNSGGNHAGRVADQSGSMPPPTAATVRVIVGAAKRSSQSGSGTASSSIKATMEPVAARTPVLRDPASPGGPALASATVPGSSLGDSLEQARLVIHDHEDLVRFERLRLERRDAGKQLLPTPVGVRADDDGDLGDSCDHHRPVVAAVPRLTER